MNGNPTLDREQEFLLRKQELDLKQNETDLKEKELSRSGWTPEKITLITIAGTIITAAIAAIVQAGVAVYNNSTQQQIETNKTEAARILGAITARTRLKLSRISNS